MTDYNINFGQLQLHLSKLQIKQGDFVIVKYEEGQLNEADITKLQSFLTEGSRHLYKEIDFMFTIIPAHIDVKNLDKYEMAKHGWIRQEDIVNEEVRKAVLQNIEHVRNIQSIKVS